MEKMKKLLYNFILTVVVTNCVYSQNFIYDFNALTTKPDSIMSVFEISRNPSLLNYDLDDERLKITSSYNSVDNRFRRFFIPGGEDFYQIQFSGKKKIGENQLFKGIFGFNKLIRKKWDLVFSKDYSTGNPFLIGDSSSGSSVFNGIYFDANYFNRFSEKFTIGAGLEYYVDEGMKRVSPKPTSQHRNILFKFGSTFSPLEELRFGISINVEDRKEEISYKEDEGAVYKEITIYKFRGVDLPIAIKKKTESRVAFYNGYFINGDLIFTPSQGFEVFGNVKKGIEQITQKEEITNPQSQGSYINDYLKVKFLSKINQIENFTSLVGFEYFTSDYFSKHPNFFTVVSDGKQKFISFNGNFYYQIKSDFLINAGFGFGNFQYKLNDYYSDVFFNLSSNLFSVLAGFRINLLEKLGIKISFIIEEYKSKKWELSFTTPDVYFVNYFKRDFNYLGTNFRKYVSEFSIQYNSSFGEFVFDFNYFYWKPENSTSSSIGNNSGLFSKLTYLVKVY